MFKCWLCLPLLAGLALGILALSQNNSAAGQEGDRISQLIKQLGSSKYAEREKAKRDLESIGLPALEQLKKASNDGDLETRRRCQELVKKLEDKQDSDRLLAPKKVKLSFKDTPVMEAVAELQKQSGYAIVVEGDRVPLAKRTVTLETGEVNFWEAFDKLCRAANIGQAQFISSLPITSGGTVFEIDGGVIIIGPVNKVAPPMPVPLPLPVQPPQKGGIQPAPADKAPQNPATPAPAPAPIKNGAGAAPPANAVALQVAQPPAAAGNAQPAVAKDLPAVQIAPAPQVQPAPAGGAIQLKPGVVQIQPMPAQPAQIQLLPANQPRSNPVGSAYQSGTVVVRDGTPEKFPTSYHGALRIRLLPPNRATDINAQPAKKGESLFILDLLPEPRLQQFSVVGPPRIDKAVDDLGQELTMVMEPMQQGVGLGASPTIVRSGIVSYTNPQPRQAALRLKLGEKQAKNLKELTGSLTVQALTDTPEAVIIVDDVMKAVGKPAKGATGGLIEVLKFEKQNGGRYSVRIRYEQPPQFYPASGPLPANAAATAELQARIAIAQQLGGRVLTSTSNIAPSLPVLVDGNRKPLTVLQSQSSRTINNGVVSNEILMVFQTPTGVGEPVQMVLLGHRMVTAQVPFRFEGIQLP